MHEVSIAQGILDTVLAALPDKGTKIARISLVAGVFSCVSQESLEFCLALLSRDTPAAGAVLEVKRQVAYLICQGCGNREPYDNNGDLHVRCPKCGSANRLEGGNELYVDSIEVDQ